MAVAELLLAGSILMSPASAREPGPDVEVARLDSRFADRDAAGAERRAISVFNDGQFAIVEDDAAERPPATEPSRDAPVEDPDRDSNVTRAVPRARSGSWVPAPAPPP